MAGRTGAGAFLFGMIVGAAAGGIAALLLAPQSGEETIGEIRERSVELKDRAEHLREEAMRRAEEIESEARRRAQEIEAEARKQAEHLKAEAERRVADLEQEARRRADETAQAGKPDA